MFGRAPRPRFTSQPMRKSFWRSCRLLCERLEDRWLLASVWQNTILPLDVDQSGLCTADDAIAVLNDLSAHGARPLPATRGSAPSNYDPDTDGNGFLTPLDALRVINGLNQTTGEMSLTADLTPQSDPDRNGIVLGASTDWQGQTQPHATVRVTYNNTPESEGETNTGTPLLETTADVAGIFRFSLDLPSRTQILRVEAVDRLGRTAELHREVRVGDAATNWNASMLKVIRDWRSVVNETPTPRVVTAAPPVMAKQLAMVHAAMFDAYQAVVRTHQPYHVDVVAPAGTSAEVAAIAAAHRVASQLYSSVKEMAIWDAALAETEAMASNPTARTQGLSIGQQVGDALLALRTADGSANQVVYTPGNQPGGADKDARRQEQRNPGGAAAVRERARQLNAAKAERDRVAQQAVNSKSAERALRAELKQLIKGNDQRSAEQRDDDVPYNFVHGKKVKRIYITPAQQRQLSSGQLVIVNDDGRYYLVAADIAERVRARDPKRIITAHEKPASDDAAPAPGSDDEYYAKFAVPDDLDW